MKSSFPNLDSIGAIEHGWPGALRTERPEVDFRDIAALASQQLVKGQTDIIDRLFTTMQSPVPQLQWMPESETLDHPQLRFLNDYWHGRIRDGELPLSRGIDVLDLRPAIGNLMLLEPIDGATDFVYRVYGTGIVEYTRVEMTGKRVWEIGSPVVATYFIATYRAVVARRMALLTCRRTEHAMPVFRWDRLILPFVDANGTIDRLLVGNIPVYRPLE